MASCVSLFLAGVCLLWTADYPGDRPIKRDGEESVNKVLSGQSTDDVVPVEEENKPIVEAVVEEDDEEEEVENDFHDEEVVENLQQTNDSIPATGSRLNDAEA